MVAHAWATLLDPHNLKATSPRLVVAIEAIVKHYGQASSAHALAAYRQQRLEAGALGRHKGAMPPSPTHGDVVRAVENAVHDIYGKWTPEALAEFDKEGSGVATEAASPIAPAAEPDTAPPTPAPGGGTVSPSDVQAAEDALAAEVEQLVLNQGRQATMGAVEADKAAKGWARVPEPGACSFCAMLSTRGAVYKSGRSFDASNKKFTGDAAEFKVHNNCRCNLEPVFNAYEPSAQIREWQQAWADLAEELGRPPTLYDWRRKFEDRENGPKRPRKPGSGGGGGKPVPSSSLGFDKLTREQLEHQLSVLEALKDSDYKREQMARLSKRLAQLG